MNYGTTTWTGTYEFKSEIKVLLESCRGYIESVLKKIEETESFIEE